MHGVCGKVTKNKNHSEKSRLENHLENLTKGLEWNDKKLVGTPFDVVLLS